MTVVACLEAVAIVVVVLLLLRHQGEEQARWAVERRELLNRIQRPDQIPVAPRPEFLTPDQEDDFAAEVGTITYLEADDG